MKTLFILLFLSLTSCMNANKHYEKAIKKGFTPEKETIEVERLELVPIYDTITNEIIRTDTVITRETRTVFQDRPITRQERLMYKDSIKHIEGLHKNELNQLKQEHRKELKLAQIESKRLLTELKELKAIAKIENKPKRGLFFWIRWIIISFVAGVLVGIFRKYIVKFIGVLFGKWF